jgi:predicted anti-sigma-YlaC factor YlaD
MDYEPEPLPPHEVDRHVASCPACQAWQADSLRLRRSMLVREAPPVPDLTAAIMDAAPLPSRERWGLRIALAVVALAQCGLALSQLLGTSSHGDPMLTGHLSNESASWNLALGIGLLWAALRTSAAAGQLPMITGFVAVLTVVSTSDLLTGHVTGSRLLTHGLIVVGLGLLFAVYRQHRRTNEPGPVIGDSVREGETTSLARPEGPHTAKPAGRRKSHRPASRHRAA